MNFNENDLWRDKTELLNLRLSKLQRFYSNWSFTLKTKSCNVYFSTVGHLQYLISKSSFLSHISHRVCVTITFTKSTDEGIDDSDEKDNDQNDIINNICNILMIFIIDIKPSLYKKQNTNKNLKEEEIENKYTKHFFQA